MLKISKIPLLKAHIPFFAERDVRFLDLSNLAVYTKKGVIMDMGDVKLLVADADASVRDIILYCSKEQGWLMDQARDGIMAVKLLRRNHYQILILELELPVINGLMICEQFCVNVPIIFISRKDSEQARLDAFAAGGNDFLAKPFYPRELVARIKNLLKLTGAYMYKNDTLHVGTLKINIKSRDVFIEERPVRLTPREYDLLLFLCRNQNQSFSRETLLNMVWGQPFDGTDRTVDTHVRSLREKIQPCHTYITTIWGYGYKFKVNAAKEK